MVFDKRYIVPSICPKCYGAGFELHMIIHPDKLGRPFDQLGIKCRGCGHRWALKAMEDEDVSD